MEGGGLIIRFHQVYHFRDTSNPPESQPFGQGQEDEEVGGVGNGAPAPISQPVRVDAEAAGQGILGAARSLPRTAPACGESPGEIRSTPAGVLAVGVPNSYSSAPKTDTTLGNRASIPQGSRWASCMRLGRARSRVKTPRRQLITRPW